MKGLGRWDAGPSKAGEVMDPRVWTDCGVSWPRRSCWDGKGEGWTRLRWDGAGVGACSTDVVTGVDWGWGRGAGLIRELIGGGSEAGIPSLAFGAALEAVVSDVDEGWFAWRRRLRPRVRGAPGLGDESDIKRAQRS